jgi:hypothetical protein
MGSSPTYKIDSVISEDPADDFIVKQAREMQLQNVSLAGISLDGTYDKVEEGGLLPGKANDIFIA